MRIAVTTPTGHVGGTVAEYLLDAGADVRLLARHPDKLRRLVTRGAGVAEGNLEDKDFVVQATRGVDALFWVTPPDLTTSDYRGFQNRVGQAAAEAIRTNRIGRVVNLSSIGAHLASGNGPIDGLHDVEKLLDGVATNILHLRPGYFFENFLFQVDNISKEGKVFLPISGSARAAMIATRDIAMIAADRLVDTSWTGRCVRELHGPADLSFDEAAAAISRGLERKVVYVKVGDETARKVMIQLGLSENVADTMLEMYRSLERGSLRSEKGRLPEVYTPTRLADFAKEVIKPLIVETAVR